MNLLYPKFKLSLSPWMFLIALFGALIAGIYGMLHDQITYTISPEYYTKLKFHQFSYANFGFPVRVYVAEVGFLATWWVGFIAGWLLARIAVPAWPLRVAFRKCLAGIALMLAITLCGSVAGYILGQRHTYNYANWQDTGDMLHLTHIRNFVCVAYIHNSSYLGGLVGLIAAIILVAGLRWKDRKGAPILPAW